MTCGIYKFTERDSGKVYIGQSKNIWLRYGFHFQQAFSPAIEKLSPIDEALKNNPEGFDFEIIELCDEDMLTLRESYWIDYYNSDSVGYNIVSSRKIYQFDLSGNLVNIYCGYAEAARSIGELHGTGNIYKSCQSPTRNAYGYKWSLSPVLDNQPGTPSINREKHSTKKRMVVQMDKEGNTINKYSSCGEAARAVGVTTGAISHACGGRTKTCKGYLWKYFEE